MLVELRQALFCTRISTCRCSPSQAGNDTCRLKNSSAGRRNLAGYTSGCLQITSGNPNCSVPLPPQPPPAPPPPPAGFRCDSAGGERGVCIRATLGQPGQTHYADASCDGECPRSAAKCAGDWDCSLAGVCDTASGTCACDAWASGADCSYLRFDLGC